MKLYKSLEKYSTARLKGLLTILNDSWLTDEEKIIKGKIIKELERRGVYEQL